MWNVVQFPRARVRDRSSGVCVAFFNDRWCVERLEAGDIIDLRFMPAQSDAERIAVRISRRDRAPLLPTYRHGRPWHTAGQRTPDDAA